MNVARRLFLIVGLAAMLGCGDDHPPTYSVSGRVEFDDGTPVKAGQVELFARDAKLNARGVIGRDGTFQLTTFHENDGAVEGTQDAIVLQFLATERSGLAQHDHGAAVDLKYADYQTSGLTIEVSATEPNQPVLVVKRRSR